MASLTNLQILRDSLLKMASGDARLATQLELLVSLTKNTGFGQSLTSADTTLDATGVTFSAPLVVGRWFVDLVVMVEATAAAFTVAPSSPASPATLAAGWLMLFLSDGGRTSTGLPVDVVSGPYITAGPVGTWVVQVRGFINVQSAGTFSVSVTGAGAVLFAGSGLTCTLQREAP